MNPTVQLCAVQCCIVKCRKSLQLSKKMTKRQTALHAVQQCNERSAINQCRTDEVQQTDGYNTLGSGQCAVLYYLSTLCSVQFLVLQDSVQQAMLEYDIHCMYSVERKLCVCGGQDLALLTLRKPSVRSKHMCKHLYELADCEEESDLGCQLLSVFSFQCVI